MNTIDWPPYNSTIAFSCQANGSKMFGNEVALYLVLLCCILFIFEDLPMAGLNSYLLSHARAFDTSFAVASYTFTVFQLGRKTAFFSEVMYTCCSPMCQDPHKFTSLYLYLMRLIIRQASCTSI